MRTIIASAATTPASILEEALAALVSNPDAVQRSYRSDDASRLDAADGRFTCLFQRGPLDAPTFASGSEAADAAAAHAAAVAAIRGAVEAIRLHGNRQSDHDRMLADTRSVLRAIALFILNEEVPPPGLWEIRVSAPSPWSPLLVSRTVTTRQGPRIEPWPCHAAGTLSGVLEPICLLSMEEEVSGTPRRIVLDRVTLSLDSTEALDPVEHLRTLSILSGIPS